MLEPKPGSLRTLRLLLPALAALAVLSAASKNSNPGAALSDAILAPRPAGGEYFGLYLLGKKVGYAFSDVSFVPGSKTQVQAVSELMFKASVGKKVSERFHKVTTLSAKENVPIDAFVTDKGEMLEMTLSSTMKAVSEPASVAKRLDQVEVFGLTRVELPKPLPENARKIPGSFAFAVAGLPEKFQKNTYRQQFKKLPGDRVEVKISASAPKLTKPASRPVSDPGGGDNLKSSILVEADHPGIKAQARKIVGDEKD